MSQYNFKTVMGQSAYKSWSSWKVADFIVGEFQSTSVDGFGKPNYKIKVIEASFQDKDEPKAGTLFTLNSNGSLSKAMEEVEEGDIIKCIYKGKDTLSKGRYAGKQFHSLEVLVAKQDGSTKSTQSDDQELI